MPENQKQEISDPAKTYFTVENLNVAARAHYNSLPPEEQEITRKALRIISDRRRARSLEAEIEQEIAKEVEAIEKQAPISFPEEKLAKGDIGFWAEDEDDEFTQVPDEDDDFRGDDMTTPAHAQLDLHRDMREYQRRIAWDMPLLRSMSPTPSLSPAQ